MWVDSSLAPLYQVTFPARASDEKLLAYCRAVANWSTQVAYPVVWLMDLSHVEQVSAQQRAMFAKYMRSMEAFDRLYTKGSALVLPNAFIRGVMTAIFWLYSPPFLHRIFAERGEGLAWARDVLAEAGVERIGGSDVGGAHPHERASRPPGVVPSTRPGGSNSAAPAADSSSSIKWQR
jgi:hypothetical protein